MRLFLLVAGDGIDGTFGVFDPAPPFAPLTGFRMTARGAVLRAHRDLAYLLRDAATGERLTDRAAPAQTPSDLLLVP